MKMKKLMIAAAIVCAAVASQAAQFNWASDSAVYLVNAAGVGDNGNYKAETTKLTKSSAALSYVLTLYSQADGSVVGTSSGSVGVSTTGNKFNVKSIDIAAATVGTTYNYEIVVSGTEASLTSRGIDGAYDYTNAKIDQTFTGSIQASMGGADLVTATPTSWNVTGVESVPEPTSGLLLLLGVAGLALKRKRV